MKNLKNRNLLSAIPSTYETDGELSTYAEYLKRREIIQEGSENGDTNSCYGENEMIDYDCYQYCDWENNETEMRYF